MQSEKDKIMELLTVTEVKEGGEVIFTDRSIEILQELGQQYKETALFKKSREDNPDWEGDANAGLLFVYMCERLTEAPSRIHTMIVCKLMIPLIWEKQKGGQALKQLTLGSLFDGIGGFCYAAGIPSGIDTGCTIKPLWAAEVEPNCIDITRYRFKDVMHVGSVTELKGDEIQPVDIITFGSPCQDLSIAGKRKGLKGNRSGLFIHAIRIIREMRLATNGQYPTFIIWENVPGAFSSNGGEDFRAVLEKVTNANIPMPASGKWATAGMVRGGEVDTAWRILDAQYWGVPQRRKRIYLIGDFGGQRAGEILFKCESVLGYTPKSKEQRAEAAGQSTNSLRAESSRGGGGFRS